MRTSLHISVVGAYWRSISPRAILSFTRKYLLLMCLVRFELDHRPFFARRIVDWLSWCRMFEITSYPWASMKYSPYMMYVGRASRVEFLPM